MTHYHYQGVLTFAIRGVFERRPMDDIDQTDVKQSAGEEASLETSSVEEPKATEEVETPEPEATAESTEETQTETEEAPKKGANARIRELNAKARSAEEKAQSLEAKLAELTGQVGPTTPGASYVPQIGLDGGEVSPEQYQQHVLGTANALVDLKIKQNDAIHRISSETAQVVRDYPQLDPESDQFDKELSDSVTEATLAYVQGQPYTASPKKYVDKLMKPYLRAVTKEVGKVSENLAKQVSQTATRPTAVSTAGGKSDAEKSIKELEAELGIHY